MVLRLSRACLLLLMVGSCASNVGPTREVLASTLGLPAERISAPRCYDIPEEPTEFGCSYRERTSAGSWERRRVMVAIDGPTWVVIDPPTPAR